MVRCTVYSTWGTNHILSCSGREGDGRIVPRPQRRKQERGKSNLISGFASLYSLSFSLPCTLHCWPILEEEFRALVVALGWNQGGREEEGRKKGRELE